MEDVEKVMDKETMDLTNYVAMLSYLGQESTDMTVVQVAAPNILTATRAAAAALKEYENGQTEFYVMLESDYIEAVGVEGYKLVAGDDEDNEDKGKEE